MRSKGSAGKMRREAMRTNTNHSRGGPPAPKKDAMGFKKGSKGSGVFDDTGSNAGLAPKGGDRSSNKATAAQAGPSTSISGGRGGLAIHPSMKGSKMHTDTCMYKERH